MTGSSGAMAVVVGRAGSKGLPGKNALALAGQPMICYSIKDARAAETVRRIIVSTDGDAIAEAAESMGVAVVRRPASLATDTAAVGAAIRHAVESIHCEAPIIVILYANVPVRPPGLIDRAVGLLVDSGADSVQSYCTIGKCHPYWMVTLDEAGRVRPHVPNTVHRRQDLPALLIPDGGVIAVTRRSLLATSTDDPHAFLGSDRRGIALPPGSVVDVDSPHDFALAEAVLTRRPDEVTV